jgi:hypothetical protein
MPNFMLVVYYSSPEISATMISRRSRLFVGAEKTEAHRANSVGEPDPEYRFLDNQ